MHYNIIRWLIKAPITVQTSESQNVRLSAMYIFIKMQILKIASLEQQNQQFLFRKIYFKLLSNYSMRSRILYT